MALTRIKTDQILDGTITGDDIDTSTSASFDALTLTGDLDVDSGTLFVDSVNSRVGVGTSSPSDKLDVNGSIKSTGNPAVLKLQVTNATVDASRTDVLMFDNDFSIQSRDSSGNFISTDYVIRKGDNGAISHQWNIGSSEAMRIDSSGNVGIGTSSPNEPLDIEYTGPGAGFSLTRTDITDAKFTIDWSGSDCNFNTIGASRDFVFKQNGSESMRIAPSGNVGIGTSSPSSELQVNGQISADRLQGFAARGGNTTTYFDFDAPEVTSEDAIARFFRNTNTTGDVSIRFNAGDGTPSPSSFLNLRGGDSFFNATGGNVGIGTSSPSSTLDVNGSLSKNSGSFKIAHPLPEKSETHNLVHSFVESPRADNVYRGTATLSNGTAQVNLDAYIGMTEGTFSALNGNIDVFLQNKTGWEPLKGKVIDNILHVYCRDETATDTISWMVVGERQDQHMLDTKWTDEFGRPVLEPEKEIEQEIPDDE